MSAHAPSLRRSSLLLAALLVAALAPAGAARTEPDVQTVVVRLADVTFEDGTLPPGAGFGSSLLVATQRPRAVLDGPGEVYLVSGGGEGAARTRTVLALAVPAGAPLSGRVLLPATGSQPARALRFRFDASTAGTTLDARFLRAKATHYERLLADGVAGAAWFRHQLAETRAALGQPAAATPGRAPPRDDFQPLHSIEDTFALATGGRAVSENLQLDRILPLADDGGDAVSLDSLEGIETAEIDWAPLVAGKSPDLDPLAAVIPADQHALFFGRFEDLLLVADESDRRGTPVVQALEPRAEEAETRRRYERQLGLPLSELARAIGPRVIASVAVTGADPYLRTGADVALLFQGTDDALQSLVVARVMLAGQGHPGAEVVGGRIDDVAYSGMRSPDRSLCSLVAGLGSLVVVTNSEAQLARIVDTWKGRREPLASAPEYVFFRDRYVRGETETAFLVLSDATIRRWCGPRWRIGDSRRTRAEAVLLEVQARHLDELVAGSIAPGATPRADGLPDIGPLTLGPDGVRSATWGSPAGLTPVLELDLTQVTEGEAALYERWKMGYEQNWSTVFDPIAARLLLAPGRSELDLSVRPLILGSEYREWMDVARNVSLAPTDGDPHAGSLIHGVVAFDKQARAVAGNEGLAMAAMMAPRVEPLSWIGRALSLYLDDDPVWDEAVAADDLEAFWEANFHRAPVALHAEVASGMALTAFLAGARAFIEQTAPDMTVWETRQHAGGSYVRVGPSASAQGELSGGPAALEHLALYYVASGEGFVLSPSEPLVQRALERQVARRARAAAGGGQAAAEGGGAGATDAGRASAAGTAAAGGDAGARAPDAGSGSGPAWLGQSLGLTVDRKLLTHVEQTLDRHEQRQLAELSWSNLPILDEWKRRYPDEDPVELHARFWHRRLVCPGGGTYRWNAQDQAMESSVFGHPGRPLDGPVLPPAVSDLGSASFGLTFEEDGLRARALLEHAPR